ncbi:hypothetical protein Tco_0656447 [Tanacetum coccineum]|uniref:Bromo domain-containing protein n=1 Tax=Tanacetum coccineum TaxID=301880 RepID=A0ABQ4X8S4_9ASTR
MKKTRKASKHDLFIQPRPKGSSEGSGVTLEVPDKLTLKRSNKGSCVTPQVPDKPSDHSSISSSDSEFVVKDILSDEADVIEKADEAKKAETEKDTKEQVTDYQAGEEEHGDGQGDNEQVGDAQADIRMTKPLVEKPETTKVSSSLTLSSGEFTSQFLNDNPDVTINKVLKDSVEPEVQSPTEHRPPLIDTTVTLIPYTTILIVSAMSRFNLPEATDKSVEAYLKNVLPKDIPDFGKIKIEKTTTKSFPKYLATPFDQKALDIYDLKDKLFKMMRECEAYNRHPTHKALYGALIVSLSVDEDDMVKELEEPPVQKKRHKDDHDQDPPTDAKKDSKKKKRKDSDAPSSKKTKNQPTSSKKGTTPSKSSKPDKSVQADETIEEPIQEMAMDDEELVGDEMVNDDEHPHDNVAPNWQKEPNAADGPELAWFNDLVHAEKDPLSFDDLIYKLDWINPEGDRCPFDMSKPLPLQGPPGHLTVPVEFFFNNDLEYLKS